MPFIFDHFRKKPFKPLYNLLVPRSIRKQWQYQYDEIPRQQQMADFWQQAISAYQQGQVPHYDLPIKRPDLVGQDIIWQYWGQGLDQLPEVAQLCFASVDKFAGKYQVIRLTDQTVGDYVDFPDFVTQKRESPQFRPAYFADLLRTALIKQYGGVWLDASVFLTAELPDQYSNYDFFVFSRAPDSPYQHWNVDNGHCYFNWNPEFRVNFLNSVIFGKPHNAIATVLLDLLLYFWQTQTQVNHYFFYQILLNELKQLKIVPFDFPIVDDALPHLLQHVIDQPFDQHQFDQITRHCSVHKLSLHHAIAPTRHGQLTYYGYLPRFLAHDQQP